MRSRWPWCTPPDQFRPPRYGDSQMVAGQQQGRIRCSSGNSFGHLCNLRIRRDSETFDGWERGRQDAQLVACWALDLFHLPPERHGTDREKKRAGRPERYLHGHRQSFERLQPEHYAFVESVMGRRVMDSEPIPDLRRHFSAAVRHDHTSK
jgi:hypothetical protein